VHVSTEVQSFLGPKFFYLWTNIDSLQNFRRLECPNFDFFSAYRQCLKLHPEEATAGMSAAVAREVSVGRAVAIAVVVQLWQHCVG
jgi:hypothetical protein